jgi:hypothetical protein
VLSLQEQIFCNNLSDCYHLGRHFVGGLFKNESIAKTLITEWRSPFKIIARNILICNTEKSVLFIGINLLWPDKVHKWILGQSFTAESSFRRRNVLRTIQQRWQKRQKIYIIYFSDRVYGFELHCWTDGWVERPFQPFPIFSYVFCSFVVAWFFLSSSELKLTHYVILTKKAKACIRL